MDLDQPSSDFHLEEINRRQDVKRRLRRDAMLVVCLVFSPDENMLAAGTNFGEILIYSRDAILVRFLVFMLQSRLM